MTNRLQILALCAEVVSGIAVVISLVFLIIELRESTNVVRASAYERSVDSLNDWRLTIAKDPVLAELMVDRLSGDLIAEYGREEALSRMRARLLSLTQWSIYEKAFYSNKYELIGPSEWSRYKRQICGQRENPSAKWATEIERFMTDEFAEFVQGGCD